MVGADLLEAVTEVAAEATVAKPTRSIQFNPGKSNRASWANPTVGPVSSRPQGNVTLPDTPSVKAFLPGFHSPENRKDRSPNRPKPLALPLCVECLRFHLEETDP